MYRTYGGVRIDLGRRAEVATSEFWSVDRLHPSERGHRLLAHGFALLVSEEGLVFEPPSLQRDGGRVPNRWHDLHRMVTEGDRRGGPAGRDLGP